VGRRTDGETRRDVVTLERCTARPPGGPAVPELPDVESHRRTIADHATGSTIRRVEVRDPDLLHGTTPQGLGRSLVGRTVGEPRRHGKWLWVPLGDDGPSLFFHFRMTGELVWHPDATDAADDALALHLDEGTLSYRSRRRLGGVTYLAPGRAPTEVTGELGPDAPDVDRAQLAELLARRRGGLKSALMDQTVIAGLGNELVDEILWRSRLHPAVRASSLDDDQTDALHHHLRDVLRRSIRAGHVPSGPTWLNGQRGQDDPRCPRCGAALERDTIAGRTAYWCPQDQPEPG
jgi:formamidopyrimidine-DNA glycosylase